MAKSENSGECIPWIHQCSANIYNAMTSAMFTVIIGSPTAKCAIRNIDPLQSYDPNVNGNALRRRKNVISRLKFAEGAAFF